MTDFKQKCDVDIIECWGNRGGTIFYLFTPRPSGCYLHQSHNCDSLSRSTSFKAALFNKVTTGHRWPRGTWNAAGLNKCEIHTRFQRQKIRVWSPGQEDCLEKEMATHSSILAWEIPWTEEPGGLVHGVTKSQIGLSTHTHTHPHTHFQALVLKKEK